MFRTAIGSLVTTSRTAMPAQTQLWNAWHQCSAPLISTGPCASSAVPMPFVPAAHSDQQNQGARLDSVGPGERGVVAPLGQDPAGGVGDGDDAAEVAHLVGHGGGAETQLGEDDVVLGRVVELRDGDRGLGEVGVDPVLLPAAMPGDRHHGPDARDLILALHEPFPRREHGAACPGSPTWARADVHPSWWRTAFGPSPTPDGMCPARAGRRSSRPGLQRTGHCVARLPASSLVWAGHRPALPP